MQGPNKDSRMDREQLVSLPCGSVEGKLGLNVGTRRQNTNESKETSAGSHLHGL